MSLWVIFLINRQKMITKESMSEKDDVDQRTGQVVCVVSPEEVSSKINATYQTFTKLRRIVGTLKCLDCVSGYKALLKRNVKIHVWLILVLWLFVIVLSLVSELSSRLPNSL